MQDNGRKIETRRWKKRGEDKREDDVFGTVRRGAKAERSRCDSINDARTSGNA